MIACSPYLSRETRLVALAAALDPLAKLGLADPYARRAAYRRRGLGSVEASEDSAALSRHRLGQSLLAKPALEA